MNTAFYLFISIEAGYVPVVSLFDTCMRVYVIMTVASPLLPFLCFPTACTAAYVIVSIYLLTYSVLTYTSCVEVSLWGNKMFIRAFPISLFLRFEI